MALLLGLVYETERPRTVERFFTHLEATDPLEIQLHLLGYYTRGHHIAAPETIRRASTRRPGGSNRARLRRGRLGRERQRAHLAARARPRCGQGATPGRPEAMARVRLPANRTRGAAATRARRRGQAAPRRIRGHQRVRRTRNTRTAVHPRAPTSTNRLLPKPLVPTLGCFHREHKQEDLLRPRRHQTSRTDQRTGFPACDPTQSPESADYSSNSRRSGPQRSLSKVASRCPITGE